MGIRRMFIRLDPFCRMVDTVKNVVDEGSIIEGVKRIVKEDFTEDFPLTSMIYKSGKYDGKIEGCVEASNEYEEKLLKQADEFIKQQEIFEHERDDYENLLNEYEQEIDRLSSLVSRTESENALLQQLLLKEMMLKKLLVKTP